MIVREGFFENDEGKKVCYEIDERLTDGKISLNFLEIGDIYHYTRRKEQHNIEVKKKTLNVEPVIQRPLDDYEKFISEFYKENIRYRAESNFFTCSIKSTDKSYIIDYLDFYNDEINEYLKHTNMRLEELAEYIATHLQSPYSRK